MRSPQLPFALSLSFDKLRMLGLTLPFALSLSKGCALERGFDRLSPNGGEELAC